MTFERSGTIGRRSGAGEGPMKSANAVAILELLSELIRERNQLRETVGTVKRDLSALQLERDELRVKLRRLEAQRSVEKAQPTDKAETPPAQ